MGADLPAIDAFIREEMSAARMPGLAISARHGDAVVLERGYGHADAASGTPMTERTGSLIGSTTKALTCMALMQLVDAGLLDLDAPIRRYLPSFRIADYDASARMTLRQAVTHTAGLPPSLSTNPAFLFNHYDGDDAAALAVEALADRQPLWPPGGTWVYANDGYTIAGRVIEVRSGMAYEDYMRRHIFAPLGLADAVFAPGERPDVALATPYDYDQDGDPYPSFLARNRGSAAAGSQLFLSARDAGIWLQALLDGGRVGDRRLCSEASFAELFKPYAPIPDVARGDEDAESWYGLGWTIGPLNGIRAASHGGSTITMGSQFILVPEHHLAVAVVANSSTEATSLIGQGVMSLMLGRDPAKRFPRVDRAYVPDRSQWPRLAGTYRALEPQNTVPGPLPILYEDGRLRATTYAGDAQRRPGDIHMYPTGDLRFVLFGRGRTGSKAEFTVEGDVVRATWGKVPLVKEG